MAGKRQRENGTWEFKFQRKGLLPTPIYFTFDTEHEGDAYAERVEGLLERGIVPVEFTGTTLKTLGDLCAYYEAQATYSKSEAEVIKPPPEIATGGRHDTIDLRLGRDMGRRPESPPEALHADQAGRSSGPCCGLGHAP